ncbi:MAG: DNA polymerase Y family protein [Cyclonatronaceae bacterium]
MNFHKKSSSDHIYDLSRNVHRVTLYNTISAGQRHTRRQPRLYVHLDMNCFYAQVEQLCYDLYGMPLVIGGWRTPDGTPRGIVATSSYEARKMGIKTGMSAFEAVQHCPYVVFMRVHYEKYRAISREIRLVLDDFAPEAEGYSMDEYFMDVTFLRHNSPEAIHDYAARLKKSILAQTGLLCSVGIARSKTYAKLASDLVKPDGLTLLLDDGAERANIWPLPLSEVWGIGKRRAARLQQAGLYTIGEAIQSGAKPFQKTFGSYFGKLLHETVSGQDQAKVEETAGHVPREISYMHTFPVCTAVPEQLKGEIARSVQQLCYRMRGYDRRARRFSAYIRFQDPDWKGVQLIFATGGFTNLDDYVLRPALAAIMPVARRYMHEGYHIRGLGMSTLELDASGQAELFFREDERLRHLFRARDSIYNRYGFEGLCTAASMQHVGGKTHFLSRD